MAEKSVVKHKMAERRRRRTRAKILGTAERPRLTVRKSLRNVFVQIVDDIAQVTLVGLASNSKLAAEALKGSKNKTDAAMKIGAKIAELAKAKGVEAVVFDRSSSIYHGRVKAVAEGARKGGLKF